MVHFKYNIDNPILLSKKETMNYINQSKKESQGDANGFSTASDFA